MKWWTFFGMGQGGYNLSDLNTTFGIEVEFETADSRGKLWGVFVYASNKDGIRKDQWMELLQRNAQWGSRWVLGGGT